MSRRRTSAHIGVLLVALAVSDCDCSDELTPVTPGSCEPTFQCGTGFEYRRGECRASRCQIDSDCCPGQKCNAAAGFCADQYVECGDDSQCAEVPGQACITFRGGNYCGYPNRGNAVSTYGTQSCQSNAECDPGRTCFGGRCVTYAPCEGGCGEGQVCDIDSNTCFDFPDCKETCQSGQILVLANPDQMSGPQCCALECKCETLPPVLPGEYGWYASVAADAERVLVSAYDAYYDDLVVAQFDHQGQLAEVQYVDGFPTSGAITANPNGPRGGRSSPGPNVGEHTSIAIDTTGSVHVAYYDRDEARLKYANYTAGMWSTSVVDEQDNVGLYTSIAMGPDGNPRIAYMMAEGTIGPDPTKRTALKLATARTNHPGGPSDWGIEVVESRVKPLPICGGGCPTTQACVDVGRGLECIDKSGGCAMCQMDEVCVDVDGNPRCETKVSIVPLDDLIEGVGLFADLAFNSNGRPVIAYYDRLNGDLRLATGTSTGTFALETLDGNDPMSPTDVGQHVSLAIDANDNVAVAYFDATAEDLVYLDVTRNVREVVDDGITPPDLRAVGADAALIFDPNGNPAIAYQDPTRIDLLYARRIGSPPMWSTEVLRGGPPPGMMTGTASGFYASQARHGARAFISNVDVSFDIEGNLLLDLGIVTKDL